MKIGNKMLFGVIAMTVIIGSIIYFSASSFQKTAKVTQGTVVNSGITYFDVKYTSDDGVERIFKGTHGKNRTNRDGDILKVFYQIDDPDKSRITDGVKTGKTIFLFAILLLLLNLVSIYQDRKRSKSANTFKTTGRKVEAEIMKIDKDMTITVLKNNPWLIDCRWTDPMTGREYTHTIRYIWVDPATVLSGRRTIDVYIDREDPEKYFMDIAYLGEIAK
jgi:hypothetical protein